MATQKWPPDLDYCLLVSGYAEGQLTPTIRSEVDTGAAKVRQRYTKEVGTVNGNFVFSNADYKKFMTFFNVTLKHGALPFDGKSPVTGDAGVYRFIIPPVMQMVTEKYVNVSVTLERI